RVVGFSGPEPADDALFCLAFPYDLGATATATLLRRHAGQWREIELPTGRAWELAAGNDGDVYVSIESTPPALIRVRGNTTEVLAPLPGATARRVLGVCTTQSGALLACFSEA